MNTRVRSKETLAELLRVLAHPVRLRLMEELSREEECVCHLTILIGKPQPYISQQLAVLKDAGLVVDRRVAQRVFYRAADRRVANILNRLREMSGAPAHAEEPRRPAPGCACPKCE